MHAIPEKRKARLYEKASLLSDSKTKNTFYKTLFFVFSGGLRFKRFVTNRQRSVGCLWCSSTRAQIHTTFTHYRAYLRLRAYREEEDMQTSLKLLRKMCSPTVNAGMPALCEMMGLDKVLLVVVQKGL